MSSNKLGGSCHFDVVASDTETAKTYYQGTTVWQIEEGDSGYKVINTGGPITGGIWNNESFLGKLIHYFQVESVEDYVASPPEGITIIETGTHPTGKAYAIVKNTYNIVHGVMSTGGSGTT